MGHWMKVNGESIYGTQASPFGSSPGAAARRRRFDGGKTRLYLHVFDWPKDGKLVVPGLANKPLAAFLLAGGTKLDSGGGNCGDPVPRRVPDKIDTVVALDIEGDL